MAWNEPGNDKDPWSGNKKNQSPPDLDKVFKDFQKRLRGVIGNNGGGSSGGDGSTGSAMLTFGLILGIILVLWAVFGFYVVAPAEKAVVVRFGAYKETVGPGLHWLPPIIEKKYKVNVKTTSQYSFSADMLTSDENIVSVKLAVQYVRENPEYFMFNIVAPVNSLEQVSASALRQVIGDNKLDYILTAGKDEITKNVATQISELQHRYRSGIEISNVSLLAAKPPEPVADAFDDVIKSREDRERYVAQAQAYSAKVVPEAEGRALRLLADAEAYQRQVVLNSQGETARFAQLLPEYLKAPQVTRERLYIAAMEAVMQNTSKVFVDVKNSNNLMYLPIDKYLSQRSPVVINETQQFNELPMKPATTNGQASTSSSNNSYLSIAERSRSIRGRGN